MKRTTLVQGQSQGIAKLIRNYWLNVMAIIRTDSEQDLLCEIAKDPISITSLLAVKGIQPAQGSIGQLTPKEHKILSDILSDRKLLPSTRITMAQNMFEIILRMRGIECRLTRVEKVLGIPIENDLG